MQEKWKPVFRPQSRGFDVSNFWSRRKEAVEAEARAEDVALVQAAEAAEDAELAERSDEELLAEAGMPEPEDLTSAEQVQDFLKSALPQRLKTRALRRLWRLNPIFANLDGLVDYGEDFTDAAMVVPDLQTVYQVGKGMLAKLEELGADEEAETDVSPDEVAAPQEEEIAPLANIEPAPLPDLAANDDTDGSDPVPASGRRMRFRFDTAEQGLT